MIDPVYLGSSGSLKIENGPIKWVDADLFNQATLGA